MKYLRIYLKNSNKQLIDEFLSGRLPINTLVEGTKNENHYYDLLKNSTGKKIFIYESAGKDIDIKQTPFLEYLDKSFERKFLNVKTLCTGEVDNFDFESKVLTVNWDKDFSPETWPHLMLYEPVNEADTDDVYGKQLYDIVFNGENMDYKVWSKHNTWKDSRLSKYIFKFNDDVRNYKTLNQVPHDAIQWLLEHSSLKNYKDIVEAFSVNESNVTKALVKLDSGYENLNDAQKKKFHETKLKDVNENSFYVSNQWGMNGDSENDWNNFISICKEHGLEIETVKGDKNVDSLDEKQSENVSLASNQDTPENISLNQILYGPPGTGKTYSTVDKALEILGTSDLEGWQGKKPNSIQQLKEAFPGQVEFVTFHQSFSYEDFVEGLRAKSDDGNLSYEIEDGVFKKITVEAIFSKLKRDNSLKEVSFSELYDQFLMSIKAKLVEGHYSLATKSEKSLYIRTVSDKETLHVYHEGSEVLHSVGRKRLKRLFDVYPDMQQFNKITNIHNEITEAIGGANSTVYWSVLNKVLLLKQEMIEQQGEGEDLSVLNYMQKKQELADIDAPEFVEGNPYVLIIDEINRGNISRIFGELITLIEDSKRAGHDEAISVKLPYSKESFRVPENLYIIGTMNTADRSLAMMDTALRRRFDFIEMMPDPELFKKEGNVSSIDGVDLVKLLTTINQRIEVLYDREHTIGHAFFMSLKSDPTIENLAKIFENKVLPLLEEYFYDDWEKIRLVLADQAKPKASGLQFYQEIEGINQEALFPQSNDSAIPSGNKSYRRQAPDSPEAYIQIYQITASNSLNEDGSSE